MRVGSRFGAAFYSAYGAGTVDPAVAPHHFPIAVGGRGFVVDTALERFVRGYEDAMRPQTDDGSRPGEKSLSSAKMWRRTYKSFHHGEGQSVLDLEDNDPYRYSTGKGVDPWTEGKLTLLNDTEVARPLAGTFLTSLIADGVLVAVSDTDVDTYDGAVWADAGTIGSAPSTAATDGQNVYVGCADGKVKTLNVTAWASSDTWTLADVDVLRFVKGRLIAGAGDKLYNLVTSDATPDVAYDHDFSDWRWDALGEGPQCIYAAGHIGDKASIYKWATQEDGTLGVPVAAVPGLPDGELVTGLDGYLGYIIVGTTKGVRFASADDTGNLTLGPVIPTTSPVQCFEPQDRFVWFGWTDYDDDSTGLGRLDLSQFVGTLTPAYASDLMTDGAGDVTSIVTYGDTRWFTVQDVGVVGETSDPAPIGVCTVSSTDFEIVENKIALFVELAHDPIQGSIEVFLERNAAGFESVGLSSVAGATVKKLQLDRQVASVFTVRVTLTAGLLRPVLRSVLLRVRPQVGLAKVFEIPLTIADDYDVDGVMEARSAAEDLRYLEALIEAQTPVSLQMGEQAFTVIPEGGQFMPKKQTVDKSSWSGTYILQLSEVT